MFQMFFVCRGTAADNCLILYLTAILHNFVMEKLFNTEFELVILFAYKQRL